MADLITTEEKTTTPSTSNALSGLNTTQAQAINSIYDSQLASQKASLESAYNQNLQNAENAQAKIGKDYQTSANDLATQYERNRANFNQQALNNGINTGAGSQAQLSMNSAYQRDFGKLRTAEAQAQTEAQQNINNLKADYQNQVNQAIADNDYKRATALLEEFNNNTTRLQNQAADLAQSGDFSGYYELYIAQGYTPEEAQQKVNSKYSYWAAANPDAAYRMGKIDANTYNAWKNGGKSYSSSGSGSGSSYDELIAQLMAEYYGNGTVPEEAIYAPEQNYGAVGETVNTAPWKYVDTTKGSGVVYTGK